MAIADISTKMVFGYSQPQEPSRVSNLYEYVCCASWLSLCITERSPAGPYTWKVISLPLTLLRCTDSSRNCLSCWDLVPTEAPPEGLSLAQLCLHGLQPGSHVCPPTWTRAEVKLRRGNKEAQCKMQTPESGVCLRYLPNRVPCSITESTEAISTAKGASKPFNTSCPNFFGQEYQCK